ncbi:MAG: radical SAM protein [Candidatus Omnitrophica bacterium]|nr:radical SAM protein [Candidatus Omnitrophota bacterium]
MRHLFQGANAVTREIFLKRRIPLAVSWSLTHRCNQKCLYCGISNHSCAELDTQKILNMIEDLRNMGMRWVSFTGGEPLLREDLGQIAAFSKARGLYVSISTNGRLVSERLNDLLCVDRVKLSLDGPRDIQDTIKGEGSFDKVMEAIELCKKNKIPLCLECVLSRYNIKSIDYLLRFASERGLKVIFQPATEKILWQEELNPLAAPKDSYRGAISRLMNEKRRGAPVYNSLSGLRHLYSWPESKSIRCSAGRLSFDIKPDGRILACDRIQRNFPGAKPSGVRDAVNNIPRPLDCKDCWRSSQVEFNLLSSLNPEAIFSFLALGRNGSE